MIILSKCLCCYCTKLRRNSFGQYIPRAMKGEFDSWTENPHGSLALIILLDQFSRNIYRNTAQSWSQDAKALEICCQGIEKGLDKELKPVPRAMFYMPLLHAEDKKLATESLERYNRLYEEAKAANTLTIQALERFQKIAQVHYNSVMLFGRYPERNQYLGRTTTVEEKTYLKG